MRDGINAMVKKYIYLLYIASLGYLLSCSEATHKDAVDYVNPNIGTIGHLLVATASMVQLPHGMVQVGQNPYPELADRYLADKVSGFSIRALPRYATKPLSGIMATIGEAQISSEKYASFFDHDFEVVTPYFSSLLLEDYNIEASMTVTSHTSFYKFKFPESKKANILINNNAQIKITGENTIESIEQVDTVQKAYYYAKFSKPISSYITWNDSVQSAQDEQTGTRIGALVSFSTKQNEEVLVKIGVSFIDMEQAKKNMENEIPDWNFEQVKNQARKIWNNALSKIKIEGGTEKERTIFYSALYRVMLASQAIDLTEQGRYFSRFDKTVHNSDGHPFYRLGSNWGSHHSLFPLYLLLEPEKQNDYMRTYVRMQEQGGWLANSGGYRNMIGRHEVATIADAYIKGYRDFDIETAYNAMKRNATEATMLSRAIGNSSALTELDKIYLEKGYFPAKRPEEKEWVKEVGFGRQAVSITLENCYDDWCMSVLAKELGKQEDYKYFLKRAYNYINVFDSVTGFMRPKTAEGDWIEPFDPIWSGGQGGRDYYTENNAWNYTWYVPHDVQGLIKLMGGKEKFVAKLNQMFETNVPLYKKYDFLKLYPDMTGWIGMYSHGNEITWHIPYFYNYAGQPWMTQRRVRQIMDIWYGDGPLGFCGDEDYGEMSSWYVLSAMGFYTVAPGKPVYDIGSPLFKRSVIDIGNGKTFTIECNDVSRENKYIQSATLNGKELCRAWFTHEELMQGGKLVLSMGVRPNYSWSSQPDMLPPSLSGN
jgi:predicted alpha-1,2-mannosidase